MTIDCGNLKGISFKQNYLKICKPRYVWELPLEPALCCIPTGVFLLSNENQAFFSLSFYCPASTVTEGEEHLDMYKTSKSVILVLTVGDPNAVLVWVFLFSLTLALSQT